MDATTGGSSRVGMIASVACAVHCALLPVALGAGASGALAFLSYEPVEWGMVIFAAVVGTVAAWKGYRVHGNLAVVTVLVLAVGALIAHAFHLFEGTHEGVHEHGIAWTGVVAGVALAVSLFVNNRLCRSCHDCAHDHAPDATA